MFDDEWEPGVRRGWWPTGLVAGGLRVPSRSEVALRELRSFLRAAFLRRTRRQLIELTDDQLQDIGVTREAAKREASRSFHLD
ncbi:DUF1127 domain-containing protein [Aureimonas psammosilenae]|uniref:DUF1127 domain-containing protein n=1 Tax=Aureimonas psammosilenae TaxID=2495496 RepID=UPI0012610C7A|nr:DUF1127 domain-containing protein [Aureimonas psammosilenae]